MLQTVKSNREYGAGGDHTSVKTFLNELQCADNH